MCNLVKKSVEFEIFSDVFIEILHSLVENESVIVNTFRNRQFISLPKENVQEIETEKEDITEKLHQFKNDFLDEFLMDLKLNFFTKLNNLKIVFLILHQKNHRKPGTCNHIIIR